jgi:hypothetical protein
MVVERLARTDQRPRSLQARTFLVLFSYAWAIETES